MLKNLTLLGLVLLGIALAVEQVVFRFVFVPSDLPALSEGEVGPLKYEPNQQGVYRIKDEIAAKFSINNAGWNSHTNYKLKKDSDGLRICLIGDSTIEALQVSVDQQVAALVEKSLPGRADSVYSFGLSGAPLSHYVYVLEKEVLQYMPDLVVIHIASSDLVESVYPSVGAYATSLARLNYDPNAEPMFDKQAPSIYTRNPISIIKSTNTYRYLRVREQLRLEGLRAQLLKLFLGGENIGHDILEINQNVFMEESKSNLRLNIAEFLLQRLRTLIETNNINLVLLIDGDRPEIYRVVDGGETNVLQEREFSRVVSQAAARHGIPVIKLQKFFLEHYQRERTKLNFEVDLHWNELGHQVVAQVIVNLLLSDRYTSLSL